MRRPNFIFILADDLGYADLGCTGAHIPAGADGTPVLDRMADDGLLFSDGYANSCVCSPTRFALISGRYQYRIPAAAEEPLAGARAHGVEGMGMDPNHPTLPSQLRDAGYATGLVGKWHLGYPPHYHPLKSGYQQFHGSLSGGIDYFAHTGPTGTHDLWQGEMEVHSDEYFTDFVSHKAVEFIDAQTTAQPFMLSVHYTAPHWPWETRDDRDESQRIGGAIRHLDGGSIATYRRMIHHMDEGIGQILAALEARGLADDTLVVFTSDNGGERFSDVWPFVGAKMDLLEGGIRVPLIARWPARIRPGSKTATPAITMDWVATFFEAAGITAHPDFPLDGVSLMPLFADPQWDPQRALFWRTTNRTQRAVRHGNWKYLAVGQHEYLFDLARDAHERANMKARDPEKLAQLRQMWEAWAATMPAIPVDAVAHVVFSEAQIPRPLH